MSLVLLAGCPRPQGPGAAESTEAVELPRASVTLRVAVVNDEPLRRAIDLLRGEWTSLTDGVVETIAVAEGADPVEAAAGADLIVFPSRAIGALCEAGSLRPVRESVLRMETLQFNDLLPVAREHEAVYGQRVMALPLGCPTPLWLRPSGAAGLTPPEDDRRLALAYLAWAAPHAVHRSREATLFDTDDFSPRLEEPPFVRALDSFAAACAVEGDPRGAIVWPNRNAAAQPPEGGLADEGLAEGGLEVSPPPGADEAYNPLADQWESLQGESPHATLVASSGRLIAVTTASRNAATAFRLAAWLGGQENSRQLSTASDGVANCRGAFARSGDHWLGGDDRELARRFSAAQADALRSLRVLFAPRLPGADRYLGALGRQVRRRLGGGAATAEALAAAAGAWRAITDELGASAQRQAYQRSVNTAEIRPAGRRAPLAKSPPRR